MLELLSHYIIQLIQSTGYIGVFILMTLESALIPIPSEVTMPFAGFLAQKGILSFWLVVTTGALANLTGSLIVYALGYYLEEHFVVSIIKKYGKFLLVSIHEYERLMNWFKKYGDSIAFFSRILPGIRTFISLPAGLSEMNIWKFSIYTFLGSFIWSAFLTYIGFYLGEQWHSLEGYFRKFEFLLAGLLIAGAIWYINHKLHIFGKKKD